MIDQILCSSMVFLVNTSTAILAHLNVQIYRDFQIGHLVLSVSITEAHFTRWVITLKLVTQIKICGVTKSLTIVKKARNLSTKIGTQVSDRPNFVFQYGVSG